MQAMYNELAYPFFDDETGKYDIGIPRFSSDNPQDRTRLEFCFYVNSSVFNDTDDKVATLNKELKGDMETLQDLGKFRSRIDRHINRLQNYQELTTDRLIKVEDTPPIVARLKRVRKLIQRYNELDGAASDYTEIVKKSLTYLLQRLSAIYIQANGERIRRARQKAGYTPKQVAGILGIGVAAYGKYELGQRDISTFTLYRLSKLFNVSADKLLGIET